MAQTLCKAFIAMALVAAAQSVHAQTSERRFFVDGGITADLDSNTYADGVQTGPAGAAAFGVYLTPKLSLRLEFSSPAWHESTDQSTFSRTGARPGTLTLDETGRHRLTAYPVLFGRDFDFGSGVRLTTLGGFSFVHHEDRSVSRETFRLASTGEVTSESSSYSDSEILTALTFGTDVVIPLRRQLALVPQVRVHAVLAEAAVPAIRPGLVVRWRF